MHKILLSINLFFLINTVQAVEPLRVVTEEYPPYQVINSDNTYSGLAVELVKTILAKAGLEARIEVFPWARTYKIAKKSPNVLIFSMVKSEARLGKFNWIGPLFEEEKQAHFVALKNREDIVASRYEDLKKYRVCLDLNAWSYEALLKMGFQPNKNLFTLRSFSPLIGKDAGLNSLDELSLKALISGVCDIALPSGNTLTAKHDKRLKNVLSHSK